MADLGSSCPATTGRRVHRVVIADDDPTVRAALRDLLDDHPSLSVVASAASGAAVTALCGELVPDAAIVDVMMPDGGAVAVAAILAVSPSTIVVAYTALGDRRTREQLLTAGAAEVLVKGRSRDVAASLCELFERPRP